MDKKSKMFALVAQWRESGLTRTVFAQQCGVRVASFDYWCKKQYNEVVKFGDRPTPKFIELKHSVVAPAQNLRPQIELTLPDGLLNKLPRSRADEVLLETIFCLEAELRGIKPLEIKIIRKYILTHLHK